MPTLTVAGGELHYERFDAQPGHEHEPPLVFLHEGLGSVELWRAFPDTVASATGRAAVVYSRHGHGWSQATSEPHRSDYMHREARVVLPALLAALDIERPVLIGHSDGASIALIYAGDGHPVAGLALLAAHVFVESCTVAGADAARQQFEQHDLTARMAKYHRDPEATFRRWNDIWRSTEFRSWDLTASLPRITCPTLVIQGEDDAYGTLAQVDAIVNGIGRHGERSASSKDGGKGDRGSRDGVGGGPEGIDDAPASSVERLVLPGCGHSPHLDRPVEVAAAVAALVARCP